MNPYSETRKEPPNGGPPPLTQGYLVFQMITLLVIPLFIILCSYSYIFIVSNRHRKQIREQADISGLQQRIKHEMKGARTLAMVIAVCLLSIIPLLVVTCLRFFGKLSECGHPKRKYYKFIFYNVAVGLNAICNPLIYGWKNKEFRRAFVKVLKCA
ncbi:Melanocortin receptor 4 [Porites harrisoni]